MTEVVVKEIDNEEPQGRTNTRTNTGRSTERRGETRRNN